MRADVVHDMVERDAQVLQQAHFRAGFVIPRHHLVEDGIVTRLTDIGGCTEDEPHRVIVEPAADIVVAAFGEGLVLVVTTAIRELGGCDIDDTLPCAGRYLVHESHEVLVRVTEAHAAADTRLEERCRTAHAEGDHTLVLVPDIHHAVHALVAALYVVLAEQLIPQCIEFREGFVHRLYRCKTFEHLVRAYLINDMMIELTEARKLAKIGGKLLILRIFCVAEDEDEVTRLTGCQFYLDIMAGDRTPAVRQAVG